MSAESAVLIASFLLYYLVATRAESMGINTFFASLFVTVPPFLLALFIRYMLWSTPNAPEFDLVTPGQLATLGAQFVVALGIFYKLDKSSDSYPTWLGWTAVGGLVLFVAIPRIIQMYVA
jgi:hypothetical protein